MANEQLPTTKQLINQIIDLRRRLDLSQQEIESYKKQIEQLKGKVIQLQLSNKHAMHEIGKYGSNGRHTRRRVFLTQEEWHEVQKQRGHIDDDDC